MWGKSLKSIKNFRVDTCKSYFQGKNVVQSNFSRGYKYFADGYITDILTAHDTNKQETSIKAKCYRRMKKNGPLHNVHLIVVDHKITDAHCSCLIGAAQSCGHLVALCYNLQHFLLQGLMDIPEERTCTDMLQKWGKPRNSGAIEPDCLLNVTIRSPVEEEKRKLPISCSLRTKPTNENVITSGTVAKVVEELNEVDGNIGFAYLLPTGPQNKIVDLPLSLRGHEHSVLAVQMTACNFKGPSMQGPSRGSLKGSSAVCVTIDSLEAYKTFPIMCEIRQELFSTLQPIREIPNLNITLQEATELEKGTRGQSTSARWVEEQRQRLTSSNFGEILKRKKTASECFLKRLFTPRDLSHVASIRHGQKYESVARELYRKTKPEVQVGAAGLVVCPTIPFLGASPDGHLIDTCETGNENGVLEIKCPLWENLNEGLHKGTSGYLLLSEEDGSIILNRDSQYFAQIQGQMLITGANWCDFVVFVNKSNELHVERVYFELPYCVTLLHKLHDLYINYAVPFLKSSLGAEQ